VTRRMIVRIDDESDTAKPKRTHKNIITQAALRLKEFQLLH
jgi:hypothetical protein